MKTAPYIGVLPSAADCQVPPGAIVLEPKACENCVKIFFRLRASLREDLVRDEETGIYNLVFRDTGERFCAECKSRVLLPAKTDDYREMIPTAQVSMRFRKNLVKYDNSLAPKVDRRHEPRLVKRQKWFLNWQGLLRIAFNEHGQLTAMQISEIVGANPRYLSVNVWRVNKLFKLRCVGFRLYEIAEAS